jgi:hypothetical protein
MSLSGALGEVGKTAQAIAGQALHAGISRSSGGNFSITISSNSTV